MWQFRKSRKRWCMQEAGEKTFSLTHTTDNSQFAVLWGWFNASFITKTYFRFNFVSCYTSHREYIICLQCIFNRRKTISKKTLQIWALFLFLPPFLRMVSIFLSFSFKCERDRRRLDGQIKTERFARRWRYSYRITDYFFWRNGYEETKSRLEKLGWVARFGLGVWQTWHENGGNQTQFVPKPIARVGKRGPRSRNPNPNISVVDILLILAKKGSITTPLCLGREGGVCFRLPGVSHLCIFPATLYRLVQKKRTVLLSTSLAWPAVAGCSRAETFSQLSSISFAQPCRVTPREAPPKCKMVSNS